MAAIGPLSGCAVARPVDVPDSKPSPIKTAEPKKTVGVSAQDEELLVQGAETGVPNIDFWWTLRRLLSDRAKRSWAYKPLWCSVASGRPTTARRRILYAGQASQWPVCD
ncbi:hypothetical protein OKW50_004166 [Paraburkholderia youngii]